MEWTYVIMPAFIMRYNKTSIELKHLETDQWIDKSTNPHFWQMMEEDGYTVSEKQALEMHEKFKQQNKNIS